MAAARAEFVRKGLSGARIEDITAACGLSKGAFYLHYRSKEALFGELVDELQRVLAEANARRAERTQALIAEQGTLTAADVRTKSERYAAILALEIDEDRRVLEIMWEYRDVADVLIRGSAGTPFEGFMWQLVDAEVKKAGEAFASLQASHAYRSDIPADMAGIFVVGTWLLAVKRMSALPAKPDLEQWASALHRVVREGVAPATEDATPATGGKASSRKRS